MLHDIRQTYLNNNENLNITEHYEKVSSNTTYEQTVELNEEEVDLMVIHKYSWKGDRIIYPLQKDVSSAPTDGTYKKGIKFEGKNNSNETGTLLKLRTKNSEKMEVLKNYLYSVKVEDVPYLSQLNSEETRNKTGCSSGCCWAVSNWMVSQTGTTVDHTDRIYFKEAINTDDLSDGVSTSIGRQEFENTVTYVKESLKAGKPVFFGTWDNRSKTQYGFYGPEAWNDKLSGTDNSPTTHFMVIVKYGFDKAKNKYYFRFYDPAQEDEQSGTSKLNKLIIDEQTREIYINNYRKNRNYKLTEIRKNE